MRVNTQISMFRTQGAGQDFRHSGITNNINAKQKQPTHLGTKKTRPRQCWGQLPQQRVSQQHQQQHLRQQQQQRPTIQNTSSNNSSNNNCDDDGATNNSNTKQKTKQNSVINKIQLMETDAAKINKGKKAATKNEASRKFVFNKATG